MNCLIKKGKKSVAERIHWGLLGIIKQHALALNEKDLNEKEQDPKHIF